MSGDVSVEITGDPARRPADRRGATTGADTAPQQPAAAIPIEWGGKLVARRGRRTRLYVSALFALALLVYLLALAASNTRHVHVDWVFGSSSLPLVWLVVPAMLLGGLLALLLVATLRRGSRPKRSVRIGGSR
jgi:uncharacterized integral membrane protein